jgi:Helix-turn-helix domain
MGTSTGACAPAPLLLDIKAAAAYVGVGVGVVRGWVREGLPFISAGRGGKKMFTRRDLERWLERLRQNAS